MEIHTNSWREDVKRVLFLWCGFSKICSHYCYAHTLSLVVFFFPQIERERLAARQQLKETNQKKSEIVQLVTNTARLKKLNRRQLRQYEKRSMDN